MRFRPIQTALAVVLGAATTVGVAWFTPSSGEESEFTYYYDARRSLEWKVRTDPLSTEVRLDSNTGRWDERVGDPPPFERRPLPGFAADIADARVSDRSQLPHRLAQVESKAEKAIARGGHFSIVRVGWPLRAIERMGEFGEPWREPHGRLGDPAFRFRVLSPQFKGRSIEPVPLGFAADTAIYGAAWWVLLLLPGAVRRRVRAARGRCTRCAYDLSGISDGACPECGKATPKRTADG